MKSLVKKYRFSQKIMLVTLVLYAVNYLLDGHLYDMFALKPYLLVHNYELWRIFTFPFVPGSYEGILAFTATFFFVGPKLESMIRPGYFSLVILMLIFLQGAMITMFFMNLQHVFAGMEGVSFFMLTLFLLLNINKKIIYTSKQPIRNIIFATLIGLVWALATSIHALAADSNVFLLNGTNALFGIISGSLVFIQLKLIKRKQNSKKMELSKYEIPGPEQLSMALIGKSEKKKQYYSQEQDENNFNDGEEVLSEDRLNEILDKILESGKESLSIDELRFLNEYSKNL